MAGQNWRKNKKGFMVNPEGKTARQIKQEKYAAKKAEAKAKASGGGGSGGREQELEKLKNDRRSEQNLANEKYNAGLAKETADWMATRRPGKKRPKISKAFKEWEKTTDAIEEKYNKLTAAIEEKYSPAKTANKGSEEIDPSRYLESNTSKTINTSYRVNKFDIDMVSSRKKAGDFDVEGEARKIASAGGVTTNLPLVAMRQDKKIEVVAGDREFFANKRAQELNPNEEMVSGVFLKSSQIKGALAQKSAFKDHEGDFTVQSGQFSRVDTADIESSIKQPSKKVLDAQVKALLDTGDVGNVIPVILQRVGKKSAVNQKYKVVSGHDSFLAMRELKRRNPNYEMTNAFILD